MEHRVESVTPPRTSRAVLSRYLVTPMLVLLVALALGVLLDVRGTSSRSYLSERRVESVREPRDAYFVWRDSGVRGRVLVVFDEQLAIDDASVDRIVEALGSPAKEDAVVTSENFVTAAIYSGQVREVYKVVDDDRWFGAALELKRDPNAMKDGPRFRVMVAGVPVVFTSGRDLPLLGEKALVYADTTRGGAYDPALLATWTEDPAYSDLVVVRE